MLLKQRDLDQIRHCLTGNIKIWHHLFYQKKNKKLKYFNDFQNQNFSVLWPKWTQTMELKQNKRFFYETYYNLTPYVFYQKILRYFNDFQNRNFSVLWLKWTQTMEMKQNQIFFHGTNLNLTSFFISHKIVTYFNYFYCWHLCKNERKQVNWNKTKWIMCKSDSIFPYLQSSALFKWLLKFISW